MFFPIGASASKIRKFWIIYLFLLFGLWSCSAPTAKQDGWITIEWVDDLEGDFSFKDQWEYPEGVYRNQFGQLSCDGFCPSEIDRMKDDQGKIDPDSLAVFYQYVDTTHIVHSIQSEAWVYEWAGTHQMVFKQQENQTLLGQSAYTIATHSSLNIKIKGDQATAWVDFNSIRDLGKHRFPMQKGTLKIDRVLFEQGIVKAAFDWTFENTLEPERELYWKGRLYSTIDKDD